MKNTVMPFLVFPAFAFFISLVLTRFLIMLLPVFGLVAIPGGRHIHKEITPKGGGVAIIVAFLVVWLVFLQGPWNHLTGRLSLQFLKTFSIPCALLVVLGLIDDKFNLRSWQKLLGQLIVAILCWHFGVRFYSIFGFKLPVAVSFVFTCLWIVGFMNAFNLIDGMDGLATGLAIVSSLCMVVVCGYNGLTLDAVVLLCLTFACLGFLVYNFYPAKIFLGDTGSMFLGLVFALSGITSSGKTATFSAVLIPILVSGVPVFDTILAVWRRFSRKILHKIESGDNKENNGAAKIMDADNDHLHHRIFKYYKNEKITVLVMYGVASSFGLLALLLLLFKKKDEGIAFVIILWAVATAIRRLATIELWNSTKAIVKGMRSPKKSILLAIAHPFSDIFFLSTAFLAGNALYGWNLQYAGNRWFVALSYYLATITVPLHVGGAYRIFWLRACANDYMRLFEILLFGNSASMIICYYMGLKNFPQLLSMHIFLLLAACLTIVGERMSLRFIRTTLLKNLYLRFANQETISKTIIYGGGMHCKYFLNEKYRQFDEHPINVVGVIDDEPALWGQYVYGYKVLGPLQDISRIHQTQPFDSIVVTSRKIDPKRIDRVKDFCRTHGVALREIVFQENTILSPKPNHKQNQTEGGSANGS